jgi:hypothetical protein
MNYYNMQCFGEKWNKQTVNNIFGGTGWHLTSVTLHVLQQLLTQSYVPWSQKKDRGPFQ